MQMLQQLPTHTSLFRLALITAIAVVGVGLFPRPTVSAAQTLDCPTATTLEDLVTCIAAQMPGEDTETVVIPGLSIQADWQAMVAQMLAGQCGAAIVPASLNGIYTVKTFTDSGVDYCVAFESADVDDNNIVDRGWGTFIVNPTPMRYVSIDIAHPKHDTNTDDQGIGVFKGIGAYTFVMAGSHRHANSIVSSCQGSFEEADVAHNTENFFHRSITQIHLTRSDVTAIQFHGMGASSCAGVDVYLTHGSNATPDPTDPIVTLKANLEAENPTWVVTVPGDALTCNLTGTTNTQGRLINGVTASSVCGTAATSYTGQFIHIEQKFANRAAADWIAALAATFPLIPPTATPTPTATTTASPTATAPAANTPVPDVKLEVPNDAFQANLATAGCWTANTMLGCIYELDDNGNRQTHNPSALTATLAVAGKTFCLTPPNGYQIVGALLNQGAYIDGTVCYTWQPNQHDYRIDWFIAPLPSVTVTPTVAPAEPTTVPPTPEPVVVVNAAESLVTAIPSVTTAPPTATVTPSAEPTWTTVANTATPLVPSATSTPQATATAIALRVQPSTTPVTVAEVIPQITQISVPLLPTDVVAVTEEDAAPALTRTTAALFGVFTIGSLAAFGLLLGMTWIAMRRE